MYEIVAFYLFAAITIFFFAVAVFSKNALYAMSSLAAGMIFIAGFFFLLDVEFLGVVQIVVYTGAIMALYAFGMMFFDTTRDVKENIVYKKIIYSLSIFSAILIFIILIAPFYSQNIVADIPIDTNIDNTKKGEGVGGKEVKGEWEGKLTRFISRLEAKLDDRRYGFMFAPPAAAKTYDWLATQVTKLLGSNGGQGIKIIDFSEVPSDVLPVIAQGFDGVFAGGFESRVHAEDGANDGASSEHLAGDLPGHDWLERCPENN